MAGNAKLGSRMEQLGFNQVELAQRMNEEIGRFTGRYGTVSDRTVRYLLSGKTRWPQAKQRRALGTVFGCAVEDLGFTPPSATPRSEDPLQRRQFLSTVPAVAAARFDVRAPRIGAADLLLLQQKFDAIVAEDDRAEQIWYGEPDGPSWPLPTGL